MEIVLVTRRCCVWIRELGMQAHGRNRVQVKMHRFLLVTWLYIVGTVILVGSNSPFRLTGVVR